MAPADPFANVTPEDFETGRLPERRATDRRQMFRRDGDIHLISRAEEEANAIRENAARQGLEEGLNQARDVIERLDESIQAMLRAREDGDCHDYQGRQRPAGPRPGWPAHRLFAPRLVRGRAE